MFERICRDERHTRVTRIIHEPIAERDFADWTMGYASLSVRELAERAGINDFFTARHVRGASGAGSGQEAPAGLRAWPLACRRHGRASCARPDELKHGR